MQVELKPLHLADKAKVLPPQPPGPVPLVLQPVLPHAHSSLQNPDCHFINTQLRYHIPEKPSLAPGSQLVLLHLTRSQPFEQPQVWTVRSQRQHSLALRSTDSGAAQLVSISGSTIY